MSKDDLVLAINKEKLLEDNRLFQGFMSVENSSNYLNYIANNSVFIAKGFFDDDVNINSKYKEIFTYSLLVNFEENRFFIYKAFSGNSETQTNAILIKPKEVWFFGVLENIYPKKIFDLISEKGVLPSQNFSFTADMRSNLSEIINIEGEIGKPQLLGFLNSDVKKFTANKFGIAYLIPTTTTVAAINPRIAPIYSGIDRGYMAPFELLEEKLNDNKIFVGQWSKQIMPSLRKMYYSDIKK